MNFRLPHAIAGLRVETWSALLMLAGVPVLMAPVFVTYPTQEICSQVEGCVSLEGSRFDWESSEDFVGFRKVLVLKTARKVDASAVVAAVESQADASLSEYLKYLPVRTPKVALVQEKKKTGKGKK